MMDVRTAEACFRRRKIGAAVIDLNAATLAGIKAAGLNDAAAFLDSCLTEKGRRSVAAKLGIEYGTVLRLTKYCDLMRLPGVSRRLLKSLYDTGYDSVAAIRAADAAVLTGTLKAYLYAHWGKTSLPSNFDAGEIIGLAALLPDIVESPCTDGEACAASRGTCQAGAETPTCC